MVVPYGIMIDVGAVVLGGVVGGLCRKVMPRRLIDALFLVTGFCAIAIGIISIVKLSSLTVVILSVLLGCVVGELCLIDQGVTKLVNFTINKMVKPKEGEEPQEGRTELLCLAMAVICFSGTGWFGALSEGMDGDHTVLIAKAVLDLLTVLVIAAQAGYFVTIFAIPQAIIFVILFFIATAIAPILTETYINNFKAVGGVLTVVVGYNMIAAQNGFKKVRVLNLIPALILCFLFTWAFSYLPIEI